MLGFSRDEFDEIIKVILSHEGGYVNNPNDPGGETNFGITQSSLDGCFERLNIPEYVEDLQPFHAKKYYKSEWWDRYGYGKLYDKKVCKKIFDMAVNIGPSPAHKIVQKSCNELGYKLKEDGILGKKTFNAIDDLRQEGKSKDLIRVIINNQFKYYNELIEKDTKLNTFINGWIKRASYEGN